MANKSLKTYNAVNAYGKQISLNRFVHPKKVVIVQTRKDAEVSPDTEAQEVIDDNSDADAEKIPPKHHSQ